MVVEAVPKIVGELDGYLKYCKDASEMYKPMDRPQAFSTKGDKVAKLKNFFKLNNDLKFNHYLIHTMIQVLWLCFYFNSIAAMYTLYEKMYLSNLFNIRYGEQNNNTQILNPFYRIVNLVKSFGLYAFYITSILYYAKNYENHENNIDYIHFLAALYSALDFSAMCFNTTSHISTKVHHTLVQILYYYGLYQN